MASATFQDQSIPGGIVHNPAAPYAREMAKWEMSYSPYGPPGRPRERVGFQAYPAAYYRMQRNSQNGGFTVVEMVEAADETMAATLFARGYREGRAAAQALIEDEEQALAVGAAERVARDRRMSDQAHAEAAAADAATSAHVAEIPETPIKKRSHAKKVTYTP